MKDFAEALMWVGVVGFLVFGGITCNRHQTEVEKLYIEKGYHRDSWGTWQPEKRNG